MSNAQHKTIRLPEGLLTRLETIAKGQGIKLSAAIRFALQRGVSAIEREAESTAPPPTGPRRKIISKGVY